MNKELIVYTNITKDGKIILDRKEFERLIERAHENGYNEGYQAGLNYEKYYPIVYPTYPYYTDKTYITTC